MEYQCSAETRGTEPILSCNYLSEHLFQNNLYSLNKIHFVIQSMSIFKNHKFI